MREYKFRGKRLDNGEWVEGFGVEVYETVGNATKAFLYTNQAEYMVVKTYEVDPATVGQYTGLKDENGKEIYEGDIICDKYANSYTPIFRNGIYMAYNVDYLHLTKQEPSTQFNVVWKNGCEIIGNVHDNKELLEG